MTKEELKKELLEKIKPGVKASDLKKLKRSKSADDISQIPDPPPLPNNNPPNHLLQDQLKEKQKQIEQLKKDLETISTELKEKEKAFALELSQTKQQLDNSLQARVTAVKVFGQEHDKRTKVEQELNETINEASTELVKGDDKVSSLSTKLNQAQAQINSLQQELKRAKIRRGSSPSSSDELPESLSYLRYVLYSLLAILFTL